MMQWDDVKQQKSDQRCTTCGEPMMKTEIILDQKGRKYEGFVCHTDKQVTWVRSS
jgi:hypothetical protein